MRLLFVYIRIPRDEVMGFTIYEVQCTISYLPASISEPNTKPREGEKKNSRLVELRSSGTTGYEDKENLNPVENGGDSLPRRGAIARRRVHRTGTIIGQFFIIYHLSEGDKFRMLQHRNSKQSPLCHRRFQRGFGFISIMVRRFRSPAL